MLNFSEPVNVKELATQKSLFEDIFVRELLAEVRFAWDKMADRASERVNFAKKILHLLDKMADFIPFGQVIKSVSKAADMVVDHNNEKNTKIIGDMFHETNMVKIEIIFRLIAKEAALRYEYFLAHMLSSNASQAVIPFAMTGVRRIIHYLSSTDVQLPDYEDEHKDWFLIVDRFLDGLINGKSGRWIDGFSNNRLQGKGIFANLTLTAEGAYCRSAARLIPDNKLNPLAEKSDWPIYYSEKTHLEKNIPKYGFFLIRKEVRVAHRYNAKFGPEVYNQPLYNYYPSVKIVEADEISRYNSLSVDEKNITSFLAFIQKKYQSARGETYIHKVWVRDTIKDIKLEGGNYSNIDFTGSYFENFTVVSTNFTNTCLNLVSTSGQVIFENVMLQGADCRLADFSNAKFEGDATHYIAAEWSGAVLGKFTNNDIFEQIQKKQSEQEKKAENTMVEICQLKEKQKQLEEKVNFSFEKIVEQQARQAGFEKLLDEIKKDDLTRDVKIKKLRDELEKRQNGLEEKIIQIAEKTRQSIIAQDIFRIHYVAQISELKARYSDQDEKLNGIKSEANKLHEQFAALDSSQTKLCSLIDNIELKLSEKASQEELNEWVSKYTTSVCELSDKVNSIGERLNLLEEKAHIKSDNAVGVRVEADAYSSVVLQDINIDRCTTAIVGTDVKAANNSNIKISEIYVGVGNLRQPNRYQFLTPENQPLTKVGNNDENNYQNDNKNSAHNKKSTNSSKNRPCCNVM